MPTPVSALLHAATLVAGGTYLLLRCSAILSVSTIALILAATFGTITAILAASTALFQYDAKRIIAYSTMSQFGYLTASIGLGQTSSTLFHLSSHSGFKALLFITAGGVIHATSDEQDIRRLGGLLTSLPFTYTGMLIGSLSLIATPHLSGFYSKDLILELGAAQWSLTSYWMWILGSLVAGITACYSIRLLAYIYLGTPSGPKKTYELTHEQSLATVISIVSLSLLAIAFGFFARESIVGIGNFTLNGSDTISAPYLIEADFGLSIIRKNWPLISTLIGVALGIVFFILAPRRFFNGFFLRSFFFVVPKTTKKNRGKKILNSKSTDRKMTDKSTIFFSLPALENTSRPEHGSGKTTEPSFIERKEETRILNNNLIHKNDLRSRVTKEPLIASLFSGFFSGNNKKAVGTTLMISLSNKWWLDALYAKIFTWPGLYLGTIGSKWIDRGVIELLGPTQISDTLYPVINNQSFSLANISKANHLFKFGPSNTLPLVLFKNTKPYSLNNQEYTVVNLSQDNMKDKLWTGSTLPDYSNYVIFFIIICVLGSFEFNSPGVTSLSIFISISLMILLTSISYKN